jgi:predicted ATPase/DNA-binding CsgD family transcriptional regulator
VAAGRALEEGGHCVGRGRLDSSSLPAMRTSFVGREREVDRIKRLLADSRLLTLTGPGGIGKTRLAIAAAQGLSRRFVGGIFFVELAAIRDPALLLPTIGAALGVAASDELSLTDLIAERLGESEALLVLDNFEQILDAAPAVSDLLGASGTLRVAVTSRTRLRLTGEQEYPVPPLEIPEPEGSFSIQQLSAVGSVALFADRARALKPDFALTETNAHAVAEICRRLDGLPLALELAAARTNVLSLAALLRRLEQRLTALSRGPRDAPARQRTLREAISWSYELLHVSQQEALRRLSVFVGGFTFGAAAEVVPDAGTGHRVDVLDTVGELVDHSLLSIDEDPDGNDRFSMLEIIREFGMEQLPAPQGELLRDRHLAYFAGLAEREQAHERGVNQAAWLRRLVAERGNFRAALTHAQARGNAELLLRLGGALERRFWLASGDLDLSESRRWLDAGLAMTAAVSPGVRAKALHRLASTHAVSAARMVSALEESLAEYRSAGDNAGICGVLAEIGHMSIYLGDLAGADERLHEGLALARRVQADPQRIGEFMIPLGILAYRRHEHVLARSRFEEALDIARHVDDTWGTAVALGHLGRLALTEHDLERADAALSEHVELARALGDREQLVVALSGLASARIASADLSSARSLVVDAANAARELNWWYQVMVLDAIAEWFGRVGAHTEAIACLAAAERTRPRTEMDWDVDRVAARSGLVKRSRSAMPRSDFDAAWAAGGTRTPADALAKAVLALEAVDPAGQPAAPQVRGRHTLSPRELEVLALVVSGLTDGEIASELFMSKKTASVHIAHIKSKLGATSRIDIALRGLRLGVVPSRTPLPQVEPDLAGGPQRDPQPAAGSSGEPAGPTSGDRRRPSQVRIAAADDRLS